MQSTWGQAEGLTATWHGTSRRDRARAASPTLPSWSWSQAKSCRGSGCDECTKSPCSQDGVRAASSSACGCEGAQPSGGDVLIATGKADALNLFPGRWFEASDLTLQTTDPMGGSTPFPTPAWSSQCECDMPAPSRMCRKPLLNKTTVPDNTFGAVSPEVGNGWLAHFQAYQPPSGTGVQLAVAAYTLFRNNLDLVYWAACAVAGEWLATCLMTALADDGADRPNQVYFTDPDVLAPVADHDGFTSYYPAGTPGRALFPPGFYDSTRACGPPGLGSVHAVASLTSRSITICTGSCWWEVLLRKFKDGDDAARTCAVVDLAVTLAHEAAHLCGADPVTETDLSHAGCGSDAYRFENYLRWALAHRYPHLLGDKCCERWADDAVACSGNSWSIDHRSFELPQECGCSSVF